MPEEHNRVLTDHAADLLLAPSHVAMRHLANEGLAHRAVNVGDVMTDVCLHARDVVESWALSLPDALKTEEPYVVATIHRAENTDAESRLRRILGELRKLSSPVVLVAHPRLVSRASSVGLELAGGSVHTITPLGYHQMLRLVMGSAGVVTDSGGLQKEAFLLGIPCTTLRTETEWTETLDNGWNILDSNLTLVGSVAVRPKPEIARSQPYGDGNAAARVLTELRMRTAG
jgi:UDP-N-acetylglucosamine 2-epimerase (non-hydrolysing)